MIRKLLLFLILGIFLMTGCSPHQEDTFKKELEEMYRISVAQVMAFMEKEERDMASDVLVEELSKECEGFIQEIEDFQRIEVPKGKEELYERVNGLSMNISDTLVLLAYSLEQGNESDYNKLKETLGLLFVEAGYLGDELQTYLGNENFVEDVMKKYQ